MQFWCCVYTQVQEMESARHEVAAHSSSELLSLRNTCEELQREGDELKEVLSAVQLDLEAKTVVGHTHLPLVVACYHGNLTGATREGGSGGCGV